jgi:hypothetical protein
MCTTHADAARREWRAFTPIATGSPTSKTPHAAASPRRAVRLRCGRERDVAGFAPDARTARRLLYAFA